MKKILILPVILSVLFFIAGIITLSDYGINWDGPLHKLKGQAYAHQLLSGQKSYRQLPTTSPNLIEPTEVASRYYFAAAETGDNLKSMAEKDRGLPQIEYQQMAGSNRISFYRHNSWGGEYFNQYDGPGHLPLIDILSAISNRLFYGALGWLGDIESYQLIYLLISAIGVFIVSLFAYQITGLAVASIISGLALGLFPIFFAESHMNMKDPEQAVFFTGAVWAFWRWVRDGGSGKWGGLGKFGVFIMFVALALAVKWNIVFLPFILIPWLFLIRKTEEFKRWFNLGRLGILGILGGLGVILFLVAIWPYAWGSPFTVIFETVGYYLETGSGKALIQPPGFILPGGINIYPVLLFLTQTPEIILILGGIGVIWVIRDKGKVKSEKLKIGYLLIFWFLVPILRLSFPGARTYGGLRQIMEILPAISLLAGLGAGYLVKGIMNHESRIKFFIPLFMILYSLFLLIPIIRFHPNQNAYFNSLAGGLKGAREKNLLDWTLTYGNIYKQGVKWINEHAEEDGNLAHLSGADFSISPLWLRDDISISPNHFSGFEQRGEYIMALYNPLDPPVFAKRYPERFLKPVKVITVDGISLLFIYKNQREYNLKDMDKEMILDKFVVQQGGDDFGDFWQINLNKKYWITRILVENINGNCSNGLAVEEIILFDSANPSQAFVLSEMKNKSAGIVEFDFPGELTDQIKIYPQSANSCFATGKIRWILVLN